MPEPDPDPAPAADPWTTVDPARGPASPRRTGPADPPPLPMSAVRTSSGDLARLDAGELTLLQYPSTELESGPAGIWLRADGRAHRLTGPACGGRVTADGTVVTAHPAAPGLSARVRFDLGDGAAAWDVEIVNDGSSPVRTDLLHTLDAALAGRDHVRRNEQYVAQYLDLTPVVTDDSLALAVRQNLPGPAHPWAAIGASEPVASCATDALQLIDATAGAGLDADRELPARRLQHEHTLAAVRTRERVLEPGARLRVRLWILVLADHPAATSPEDAALIARALAAARLDRPVVPAAPADARGAATDRPGAPGSVPGRVGAGAGPERAIAPTVLSPVRSLPVRGADETEIEGFAPGPRRHQEGDEAGLLSFFTGQAHVVTARKEGMVLRPHGHLQHVSATACPDRSAVASTAWMSGIFCSQLTRGHASAAPVTSIRRSYLGLLRGAGIRLAARPARNRESRRPPDRAAGPATSAGPAASGAPEASGDAAGEGFELLSVPSLWSAEPERVRWCYLTDSSRIDVAATLALDGTATLEVELTGAPLDLLAIGFPAEREMSLQVTADGVPLAGTGDELLTADGRPRGTDTVTALAASPRRLRLTVGPADIAGGAGSAPHGPTADSGTPASGRTTAPSQKSPPSAPTPHRWRLPVLTPARPEAGIEATSEFLRWLVHDAAVHHQAPRGLEQYSGGAWGTRDVSQGPVGLLLATDEHAALRETLTRILSAQQDDGTWPQWFDFLPGHAGPGHRDAHGDVVYWPLLALGEYLAVTGDRSLLEEALPFVGEHEITGHRPVHEHVVRAMASIASRRTRDARLPAYGHGDWNDSLQPAHPELARRMCSSWTTELEIHALTALADGLTGVGAQDDPAWAQLIGRARTVAEGAQAALGERLLVDGELAGYAVLGEQDISYLVHPRDETTGLRHGSLQMIHAITGELLTPEQARSHHRLVTEQLQGPTGVYLFDAPIAYHGGPMTVFQRAEAATFWGREIGLMYTHAHIRWVEALAALGQSEQMWDQLLAIIPIGLPGRIPGAAPRQSNCYYSSSDAGFPDRRTASEQAGALFDPATRFEGGWRVYSSGPGLILRLVVETVLGIRQRAGRLEIDPVLPAAFDGLEAQVPLAGGMVTVLYRRGEDGCGVREVRVDGEVATGSPLSRTYRAGGVAIDTALVPAGARLEVLVG